MGKSIAEGSPGRLTTTRDRAAEQQDQMNVERRIVRYLQNLSPGSVETGSDLHEVKLRRILDSLDMLEFISFVEQAFSVQVGDRDILAKNFETVGSVITFVEGKLSQS